jgi:hypothetical protein
MLSGRSWLGRGGVAMSRSSRGYGSSALYGRSHRPCYVLQRTATFCNVLQPPTNRKISRTDSRGGREPEARSQKKPAGRRQEAGGRSHENYARTNPRGRSHRSQTPVTSVAAFAAAARRPQGSLPAVARHRGEPNLEGPQRAQLTGSGHGRNLIGSDLKGSYFAPPCYKLSVTPNVK